MTRICTACPHQLRCLNGGSCRYGYAEVDREPSYPQRSLVPAWAHTVTDAVMAIGLLAASVYFATH